MESSSSYTELVSRSPLLLVLLISASPLFRSMVEGDPRATAVKMTCNRQKEHNSSTYVPNFVATMESIGNKMQASGFGISSTGEGVDANFGLAQCYGDFSPVDCIVCYSQARMLLPRCYPYNGGRIFLDGCFMRGENYPFYGEALGADDEIVCGNRSRRGEEGFEGATFRGVGGVIMDAIGRNGYARREEEVGGDGGLGMFLLANCWRSLNAKSCGECLRKGAGALVERCLGWSEGRALMAGCFIRYSDVNFLNAEHGSGKFRGSNNVKDLAKMLNDSSLNFKFSTIDTATKSFNDAYKIGQGGFGTVYKGVLADGREIAVKRLFQNNKHRVADFYNEVNIISSVEHKNLVRLLGCSCSGPESLLIYEFLPNQSLDRFIFDPNRAETLNWEKRIEIITGMAEGLVYLHENPKIKIIHRDIKASNILLDSKFRAKIADFGLARSFQEDKSHISTVIAGTLGYMAPEYLAHGQLTEKADVYSFGVLLMEIISGKQNNKNKNSEFTESLVIIVWKHFQEGRMDKLMDSNLIQNNSQDKDLETEVSRGLHIGLLCTQETPSLRPTMSKVLNMLCKKIQKLPAPSNPPFMNEQTMEINYTSEYPSYPLSSTNSNANLSHSSFYPR